MKYIILFITILFLYGCEYEDNKSEDYNFLEDNSLRFIKNEEDTSILINKDNIYYLLLLGQNNPNINVNYLIKYQNIKTNNYTNREYLLNKDLVINDLIFKINDKIEIIINNYTFCIYIKEINRDNFYNCDFIYLYNIDDDFYITLNNNLLVLFYDAYTKFNYKFMYHLSTVWIDSYTISEETYTTITINQDNFEVISTKRRGKTIHKSLNS